ncbi:sporulation delaying protein family toxin [Corynebacterium pseudogenitalium]|nr:sporulation delaying protein family toxin [Corynebacterium pseudogenitalium]
MKLSTPLRSKVSKVTATSLMVLAVTLSGAIPNADAASKHSKQSAHQKDATKNLKYSDSDIVDLLVFSDGPAATNNPELAKLLQSNNPDKYVPTSEDLDIAQDLLETEISDFHQEVTVPIQSGDPYKVTDALDRVSIAIQNITAEQTAQTPAVSTYGMGWHDANLWVEINGAAVLNGAVYANVALATEALVALYVVPGAISYQFPKTKGTLDGQNLVAALSEELA